MSNEIPGPPGVPLLGNIFDVNPNETWNSLNKLASEYGKWKYERETGHNLEAHPKLTKCFSYRSHLQDQRPRPPDCFRR